MSRSAPRRPVRVLSKRFTVELVDAAWHGSLLERDHPLARRAKAQLADETILSVAYWVGVTLETEDGQRHEFDGYHLGGGGVPHDANARERMTEDMRGCTQDLGPVLGDLRIEGYDVQREDLLGAQFTIAFGPLLEARLAGGRSSGP